jgi:dTDP-4-dehydrorhamnose reductase
MKIFLTGASGMLAAEVAPEVQRQGHEVLGYDLKPRLAHIRPLDITDKIQVFDEIKKAKPDFVFHLAAETDVDRCEKEPDHAFKVNTLGTENIALACQELNIPMLYVSTAGVFYGDKKTPHIEFDPPNPKNIYGHSKLQGEVVVRNLLSRYFIVRAGWMVGGWEIDKKFVYKIVSQIKEGKTELRAVSDKSGSPCFTKDFAKNVMTIVDSKRYGLYHLCNKGTCSRFEIAVKIVEFMGLKDKVKVIPVDSSAFPLPAPRADSEMMYNYKLDLLGLNNMPPWEQSLEEYVKTNKDK